MMRFSECRNRTVLDTSAAQDVGRIDGFVVDASAHRIHAVRVGKAKGGSVLRWADIKSFGPDAVTVESAAVVRDPEGSLDEAYEVLGRRLLTDRGFELGPIVDMAFDPATGELEEIHLEDPGPGPRHSRWAGQLHVGGPPPDRRLIADRGRRVYPQAAPLRAVVFLS